MVRFDAIGPITGYGAVRTVENIYKGKKYVAVLVFTQILACTHYPIPRPLPIHPHLSPLTAPTRVALSCNG